MENQSKYQLELAEQLKPSGVFADWLAVHDFYRQYGNYFRKPTDIECLGFAMQELGEVFDALSRMPGSDFNRNSDRSMDYEKETGQLYMMLLAAIQDKGNSVLLSNTVMTAETDINYVLGKIAVYIGSALSLGNRSNVIRGYFTADAIGFARLLLRNPSKQLETVLQDIYKKRILPKVVDNV